MSQISTHTSLAGRDPLRNGISKEILKFLLTRPSRGATLNRQKERLTYSFLLTRLLRGATAAGRLFLLTGVFLLTRLLRGATAVEIVVDGGGAISTHTPLARRDLISFCLFIGQDDFYSHASYEARHGVKDRRAEVADFYSHASYEARRRPGRPVQRQIHFYSHASYEARLIPDFSVRAERKFLLTRLLRGATIWDIKRCPKTLISTHTPLARRDLIR